MCGIKVLYNSSHNFISLICWPQNWIAFLLHSGCYFHLLHRMSVSRDFPLSMHLYSFINKATQLPLRAQTRIQTGNFLAFGKVTIIRAFCFDASSEKLEYEVVGSFTKKFSRIFLNRFLKHYLVIYCWVLYTNFEIIVMNGK